ncbi:hypothetical protein H5410_031675 [Solanum commersonii]|uniref:Uncharacterized protein n=1 Tax=Solanum commersonii TaxID=4109 RepID=A0A9J5YIZ9_SOLCO|nr:hypothetical protein H5410_031675 [Solanum commersonii]
MSSNGKTGTTLQIFISSQKFNNYGRYLSVTAVQRQRSSVIIVPENTFNAGSKDVATNMAGATYPLKSDLLRDAWLEDSSAIMKIQLMMQFRWIYNTRKDAYGVQFLTRKMEEDILVSEWRWPQSTLELNWWKPASGCIRTVKIYDWIGEKSNVAGEGRDGTQEPSEMDLNQSKESIGEYSPHTGD